MLSAAYFCALAHVKICHALPAEGRRHGAGFCSAPRIAVHPADRSRLLSPRTALGTLGCLAPRSCLSELWTGPLPAGKG